MAVRLTAGSAPRCEAECLIVPACKAIGVTVVQADEVTEEGWLLREVLPL